MHFKALKIFCDVVGRRSFSRAADENGISQSGASQVVHQLEAAAGRQADRPLEAAVRAHARGRSLLRRLPQAGASATTPWKTRSARCTRKWPGGVRVASIYSVGLHHMNRYLQEFLSQYPKANVRLEYLHPHRVYEASRRIRPIWGWSAIRKSSRTIEAIRWREEPMVLVCAPGHRLGRPRADRASRSWPGENVDRLRQRPDDSPRDRSRAAIAPRRSAQW